MPTRTARTAWNGNLETGEGQVELTSSQLGTYDVSFPKRSSEEANGFTSPEELLAAAHSACYAMQFSAVLTAAGGTVEGLAPIRPADSVSPASTSPCAER
jgi:osmotically inducible protein OsmC